jgi:hypothetical protein
MVMRQNLWRHMLLRMSTLFNALGDINVRLDISVDVECPGCQRHFKRHAKELHSHFETASCRSNPKVIAHKRALLKEANSKVQPYLKETRPQKRRATGALYQPLMQHSMPPETPSPMPQPSMPQPSTTQPSMSQHSMTQPSIPQPSIPQPSMPQPSMHIFQAKNFQDQSFQEQNFQEQNFQDQNFQDQNIQNGDREFSVFEGNTMYEILQREGANFNTFITGPR